ncbi:PIG-L deacetylase family protein [Aldersonia kunmingensis]|uniref:PIG-L deacetylase family protein n=1 Tax=Aldersonia kunmingensis TaxID=408066 RepID=UPI000834800B|nr:PIG-L family deacetylase [Aldersonia kunmingensis]
MNDTASAVAGLGTILGIWAHPDDEAYLSGGVMALARDLGSRVVCVTATHGERGTDDPQQWPPERLAAQRTQELADCLAILGVTEHVWLGYRDGECASVEPYAPIEQLSRVIDRVQPDTVLTFGPDGVTGHPDHRAISAWATAAFGRAAPAHARMLYPTAAPRREQRWSALNDSLGIFPPGLPVVTPDNRLALDLVLDGDILTRKVAALRAQETQTRGVIEVMGPDRYNAWVADESFVDHSDVPAAVSVW